MPTINLGKIRLNWRGEWDAATAYEALDAVSYAGDSFVCITANTGSTPKTAGVVHADWDTIAEGATQLEVPGDLIIRDASGPARLAIGAPGQVLTAASSGYPSWTSNIAHPVHRSAYQLAKYRDSADKIRQNWGIQWTGDYLSADRRRIYGCGRTYYGNNGQAWGDSNTTSDEYRSGFQPASIVDELEANDFILDLFVTSYNSYFITNNGYLYATGHNGTGQLGDGTTTHRRWYKRVSGFGGVNKHAVKFLLNGEDATQSVHILTGDGEIWSWGYNGYGTLGDGTTTTRTSPVTLTNVTGVVFTDVVSGGCYGAMVYGLTDDGHVWAWGSNRDAQGGDGSWAVDRNTPFLTSLSDIVEIQSDQWRYTLNGVGGVPGGFTIAKDSSGQLWGAGDNSYGQLCTGNQTRQYSWFAMNMPAGVTCNKYWISGREYPTVYMLGSNGILYSAGAGNYGKAGNGSTSANNTGFVACNLPAGFQGNIEDIVTIGGGSYGTTWVKTTNDRWASFGYHGYGVIGDATESTANTTNHAREITKYMPWTVDGNESGVKNIFMGSIDQASYYFAVCHMNDGTIYYLGRDDGIDRYAVETYYRNVSHFAWRRSMRQ
jgi:alpha-tubulin suppressor-like RCC1 family protein